MYYLLERTHHQCRVKVAEPHHTPHINFLPVLGALHVFLYNAKKLLRSAQASMNK